MEKIKLRVTGNQIEVTERPAVITAGTVGLAAEFTFDSQWDKLTKTAVFKAGDKVVAAALMKNTHTVPWEVLEKPDQWLCIGVYGANADGTAVIPTLWAKVAVIHTGADPEGDPALEPTAPVWQEVLSRFDGITAESIGAASESALTEVGTAVTEVERVAYDNKAAIENHINNVDGDNPHGVTCEQIGAATMIELGKLGGAVTEVERVAYDNKAAIENHINNTGGDNPHGVTCEQIGAAPSGYGLGEKSAFAVNWNNGFLNAFTRSNQNSPDGKWWYGLTCREQSGSGTTTEIAFCVDSGNSVCEVRRSRNAAGAWGAWEYVNPPMHPGVEYRTTERFMGKPVYTKLINGGQVENGKHIDVDGLFIRAEGCILRCDEPWYPLPYGQKAWLETETYTGVTLRYDSSDILEDDTYAVQIWYVQ